VWIQANRQEEGAAAMAESRTGDNDRIVQPNKERGGWDVVKATSA